MAEKPSYNRGLDIRPRISVAINLSSKPERVLTAKQWQEFADRRDR